MLAAEVSQVAAPSARVPECSVMAADEDGEREARSVALERTYVHDVYGQMAEQLADLRHRPWPRVRQFLADLEPGSLVCDVGCGDGKYLTLNADAYFVGGDRCERLLVTAARQTRQQVVVCDALGLPFRDESVDAAVSVAVIHHLATTERRVRALRELARVLRIGGRLIVTVWAMEQRSRKFESQDVLVPWSADQAATSGSEEKMSLAEPEAVSTTSDDDLLNYSAFTQTSDSDSSRSTRFHVRRTGRRPRRVRSIDPTMVSSSQSSSGLSSPSESCYSFVRRALQKLARRGEVDGSRPWILSPWTSYSEMKPAKPGDAAADGQLIEIRLDDDVTGLEEAPRRRNTFGCEHSHGDGSGPPLAAFKSRSVGDMWSLLSASILGRRGEPEPGGAPAGRPRSFAFDEAGAAGSMERSRSSSSALLQHNVAKKGQKSVTFSTQSLTLPRERLPVVVIGEKSKSDSVLDSRVRSCELMKASLTTVPENDVRDGGDGGDGSEEASEVTAAAEPAAAPAIKPSLVRQRRLADEPAVPRVRSEESPASARPVRGILKQTSLNENLMRRDWAGERQQIRANIRKQQSLNENVIYGKQAGSQEAPKVGYFANYSRLKMLRDSLGKLSESLEKLADSTDPQSSSLKNGLVKMVRQLTDGAALRTDGVETERSRGPPPDRPQPPAVEVVPPSTAPAAGPRCSPPDRTPQEPAAKSCTLPVSPVCTRNDRRTLYRYCSRERKTSREESSDSSKENSFQSDTSLDSEDSCVSVIFVPKVEAADAEAKERSRSASSESSDGSNGKLSPKSPLTTTQPLSPTRLAAATTGRVGGLKTLPKLGAQVLQSNLHGRFHLMEPPAGGGGSGARSGSVAGATSDKGIDTAKTAAAPTKPAPSRAQTAPVVGYTAVPPAPTPITEQAPQPALTSEQLSSGIDQDTSSTKRGSMPRDVTAAPRSLPDVVTSSGAEGGQRATSLRDRAASLAASAVQPPSPAPVRGDLTSFQFRADTGGGGAAAVEPDSRSSLASSLSSASSLSTSDCSRATSLVESSGAERTANSADDWTVVGAAAAAAATKTPGQDPGNRCTPITARQIFDRAEAAAAEAHREEEGEEVPVSRQGSSEDSLPSDQGGALGHHRYYHVFREGELDRLIEKYVDNLHIISSYYDHANWCVVAEKVQVWTI